MSLEHVVNLMEDHENALAIYIVLKQNIIKTKDR